VKAGGKRVAITAAMIGIATIALTAFLGRDRIAEECWLWKLSKAASELEEIRAIKRLGELRSARAVPIFFQRFSFPEKGRENLIPAVEDEVVNATLEAVMRIGGSALPHLIRGIDDQRFWVREISYPCLEQLGPQAEAALPAIIAKVHDRSSDQRSNAIGALTKIAPPAVAVSHLIDILEEAEGGEVFPKVKAALMLAEIGAEARIALPALKSLTTSENQQLSEMATLAVNAIEGSPAR
jgi:hypothetical protein